MSELGSPPTASDGLGRTLVEGGDRGPALRSFVGDGLLYLSVSLIVLVLLAIVVVIGTAMSGDPVTGFDVPQAAASWAAYLLPLAVVVLHPLLWWFGRRGWSRGHLVAVTPLFTLAACIVCLVVLLVIDDRDGMFALTLLVAAAPAMFVTTLVTTFAVSAGPSIRRPLLVAGAACAAIVAFGALAL